MYPKIYILLYPVTSTLVSETAVFRGPGLPSSIRLGFSHLTMRSGGIFHRIVSNDSSPLRWPAPAETARHGRLKSTPVARSGGGPRHDRRQSPPVARSGGGRSPRSTQVHSGGPLRRRPLATVDKSQVREVVLAP